MSHIELGAMFDEGHSYWQCNCMQLQQSYFVDVHVATSSLARFAPETSSRRTLMYDLQQTAWFVCFTHETLAYPPAAVSERAGSRFLVQASVCLSSFHRVHSTCLIIKC
jgi:hypothetical protein